ncbi:MAG: M12 family metallopeptidase, partial [Planctomycetota bacterium]
HPDLDYVFDDVNGDGFPDHVDFDGDDAPDALVLSQGGAPGVVATATTGVRDFATNDIFAGAALTTVTDAFGNVLNVRSGPPFADFNGDGILDAPMQVVGEIGINPAALSVTAAGVPHVPNAYDAGIAGGPDVNGDLIPDGDGIPEFIEFPSIDPTVLDEFGDPADLGELDVLSNLPADGFESLRVLDVPVVAGSSFTARLGPTTAVQGTGNGVGERIPTSHVYFVNFNISTVMHEVMHQLGYQHEQKRLDREDFVFVDFGNIPPDLAAQFFVAPGDRILGVPFDSNGDGVDDTYDYDFESLMHYGRCGALFGSTCSADQLAMEVLPPFGAFQDVIGSTDIISAGDLVSLQEVYLKPQVFVDAPCLADLNQDNRITFEDILEFINLYLPCADPSVNPIPGSTLPNDPCRIVDEVLGNFDGFVDTLDLINYFTLFRASRGCTPRTVVPIGPGTPVGDNSLSPI